ncbi:hypothetical protein MFLAVUS_007726 [Mucor flavus]|uniref:Uncharacterized protein n=1 Tax=Mucor flavus TaxID=439312 RepID=A0ABP9Z548_9FUNG
MSYSSYEQYIFFKNFRVLLALLAVNYIVFNYNLQPLTYIFNATVFKAFEFLLSLLCLYNIWSAIKGFFVLRIEKIKVPYGHLLFVPGPVSRDFWYLLRFLFKKIFFKKPVKYAKLSTPVTAENPKDTQLFTDFFDNDNQRIASTTYTGDPYFHSTTTPTYIDSSLPFGTFDNPITPKSSTTNAFNCFSVRDATTIKLTVYSNPDDFLTGATPKLRFSYPIRPPLQPSAYRPRILWYLHPTPEVVEDFQIEQILAFRKYWHKSDRHFSSVYYDKMTSELHERVFKPLAMSICNFTAILIAGKHTISKCPLATLSLSSFFPGFNNNSKFTLLEVTHLITLKNYENAEAKEYVIDRILDLACSNKLTGYRFTPKRAGMPEDAEIIMHILSIYLSIKEPKAIPPLVSVTRLRPLQIIAHLFLYNTRVK